MRGWSLIAVLFLLCACKTTENSSPIHSRLDRHVVDRCPDTAIQTWHDCYAYHGVSFVNLRLTVFADGRYENGEAHGEHSLTTITEEKHEVCKGNMLRGKWEGPVSCFDGPTNKLISQKVYVDGEEIPKAELAKIKKSLLLSAQKEECSEIGFKPNTEGHANCVLELIKIHSQSTQSSGAVPSSEVQELIELKIKREKQYQADRKIEGWRELLEFGRSLSE